MAQMFGAKAGIAAIFALLVSSPSAYTAPAASAQSMRVGAITSQPIGHYEFCETHADECRAGVRNNTPARVTAYGWSVIREVNAEVNGTITPMTDRDLYGQDEFWSYPEEAGDCEDFVLLKRKMLIEKGFSVGDLLITVVRKPDGEGHAVLTVRTTEGDFILDNLDDAVKPWTATPYRYLKRQASFHAGRWVSIENGDAMMVSSVGK
ncbi:transglutaminase-like cysteine peptidase [Shinella daejeonensis]|uniref:transglutaminase-like cysteine peptidase n=1 Tax=Shinella daejeonensis TaxID=659017 RepID=UPI0020C7EF77|nr:transglutaminase-like cysteine peptidase [Shinella daejeonensis]MCP8896624.1 transglutaminase-like cysteine peptidase [Shinella daejeonensis]